VLAPHGVSEPCGRFGPVAVVVRALPIRLAPVPGEALDSYLEALACRSRATWGDIIDAVGLGTSAAPVRPGSYPWVGRLTGSPLSAVSQSTGVDVSTADDAGGVHAGRGRQALGAASVVAAAVPVLRGVPGRRRGRPLAAVVAPTLVLRMPAPQLLARRLLSAVWSATAYGAAALLADSADRNLRVKRPGHSGGI
jgi:hypothetical protein